MTLALEREASHLPHISYHFPFRVAMSLNIHNISNDALLSTAELAAVLKCSSSYIRKMVQLGQLPLPRVINKKRHRWLWGSVVERRRELGLDIP